MKPRSHRIRREFLCVGMAFLLVMLMPHTQLKPISIPVVQAQDEEVALTLSGLQFDGSRYYFMLNMVGLGYIHITWQIYVNSEIDQIANEVVELGVGIDMSVFPDSFPGCFGTSDCDIRCNNCVQGYINNCKAVAVGAAIAAGLGISRVCWACVFGSGAITPVSVACTIGCALLYIGAAAGVIGAYLICKGNAPGSCTNQNPPCQCRMVE